MWLNRYYKGDFQSGRSWIVAILWYLIGYQIVRSRLIPFSKIKVLVLKLFGARIGNGVVIKPGVRIKFPWRLSISHDVWIGEDCWIDNLAHVAIGSNSCISQGSYLCTGNHDWKSPFFHLVTESIIIGRHVWLGAGAKIGPGSLLQDGTVISMGSSFTGKSTAWNIYQGNPAKQLKIREDTSKIRSRSVLLVNQNFYPDQSATSQYLQDLAVSLTQAGHRVTVLASGHGYLKPEETYSKRESWKGIQIIRASSPKPSKHGRLIRAISGIMLNISFAWNLIRLPRFDSIVVLTSPPLVAWTTMFFAKKPRENFNYWVMDLNPDQAVAAGIIKRDSFLHRILESALRSVLVRSDNVIVLDDNMKERVINYGINPKKISLINLWTKNDLIAPIPNEKNSFRDKYNLSGKYVVMYSGNMSLCHPLESVIDAANELRHDDKVVFVFIGDGIGAGKLKEKASNSKLTNILFLPYQDVTILSNSISAGDLHLVSMAEQYNGIIHPSKYYGILAAGRPQIFLGSSHSFIGSSVVNFQLGAQVDPYDKQSLISKINYYRSLSPEQLDEVSSNVKKQAELLSKDKIVPKLIDRIISHPTDYVSY